MTCDSKPARSDTSDNKYMPSEHSDQEECDSVSTMKLILMEIT